jgi:hypothetical protein
VQEYAFVNKDRAGNAETPARRYEKPELKEFGTIAELTATIGNMALADAGLPPDQKSQV